MTDKADVVMPKGDRRCRYLADHFVQLIVTQVGVEPVIKILGICMDDEQIIFGTPPVRRGDAVGLRQFLHVGDPLRTDLVERVSSRSIGHAKLGSMDDFLIRVPENRLISSCLQKIEYDLRPGTILEKISRDHDLIVWPSPIDIGQNGFEREMKTVN